METKGKAELPQVRPAILASLPDGKSDHHCASFTSSTHIWLKSSQLKRCVPWKIARHTLRRMAHSTPSLMSSSSQSTPSLFTSTPVLPSTTPSRRLMQTSLSDEINHCDYRWKVSFGSLAESHTPTDQAPTRMRSRTARISCPTPVLAPKTRRETNSKSWFRCH